jgi:hypothetical protein
MTNPTLATEGWPVGYAFRIDRKPANATGPIREESTLGRIWQIAAENQASREQGRPYHAIIAEVVPA